MTDIRRRLVGWLRGWIPRPSFIHQDPDYREAHRFKNEFEPDPEVEYTWVVSYAREVYSHFEKADEKLDAKAESIIKILGAELAY